MRMAFPLLILLLSGGSSALTGQSRTPADDVWKPLRPWLGTWEGTSKGRSGDGAAKRTYRLVLREQFVEVHNRSTYPPQPQNPRGEVHEDVGYISYDRDRKTYVYRQFHVEGFVNTYVGVPDASGEIVFTSQGIENIPAGWRARETYRPLGDDERMEKFELAEPGKEFSTYSETRLKRTR
jgi:THAP4-like, heme-binding beta-barrel domain